MHSGDRLGGCLAAKGSGGHEEGGAAEVVAAGERRVSSRLLSRMTH